MYVIKNVSSRISCSDGFVILPSAFKENILNEDAWNKIKHYLKEIRKDNESALFAVRSSALSEDSAQASFAGEFETVLNVKTDEEIQSAIYEVFSSRESERVKAYSSVQGMDQSHQIAVVIQIMIQSEISEYYLLLIQLQAVTRA